MAEKTGLNFTALQQVLRSSSAQSFVVDNWLDRFKLAGDPMEIRRRRTEVFQKSLAPALEIAARLGLSLAGTALAERLLPRIMGIEESHNWQDGRSNEDCLGTAIGSAHCRDA